MRFSKEDVLDIIRENKMQLNPELQTLALNERKKYYGNSVYVRGLIEFTNYCKNNCYYCGISAGNKNVNRYRLSKNQILECCKIGAEIGFKTYVLQGGEDPYYTDDMMCDIVYSIKSLYPESAVTLSLGERDRNSYKEYFNAGADRFLLRHETATESHYKKLHPDELKLSSRKKCLYDLKDIGFQVGAGFMVGSPYQTDENLAEDIMFLQEISPEMVGIGPFIPHIDTRFKDFPSGTLNLTLVMLSITRLALPKVLLPSTTALGTISPNGREEGLKCGANVVMPNLSPIDLRKDYSLYDNKIYMGAESSSHIDILKRQVESVGCKLDFSRGDNIDFAKKTNIGI